VTEIRLPQPPARYDEEDQRRTRAILQAALRGQVARWDDLFGRPATFPPSPHTHVAGDITGGVFAPARLATGTATARTVVRGDGTWGGVLIIRDEGAVIEATPRSINFSGTNVSAVTDANGDVTVTLVGGGGGSVDWADVLNKPTTFPPSAHTHDASAITTGALAVARGGLGLVSYPITGQEEFLLAYSRTTGTFAPITLGAANDTTIFYSGGALRFGKLPVANLVLPGGTSAFLRADGTWAAPVVTGISASLVTAGTFPGPLYTFQDGLNVNGALTVAGAGSFGSLSVGGVGVSLVGHTHGPGAITGGGAFGAGNYSFPGTLSVTGTISGPGGGLTGLQADQLTAGVVPSGARLGTSGGANNQFLRFNTLGSPIWAQVSYSDIAGAPTTLAINVRNNNGLVGVRPTINFIDGSLVTWTVTDNVAQARVDITPVVSAVPASLVSAGTFSGAFTFASALQVNSNISATGRITPNLGLGALDIRQPSPSSVGATAFTPLFTSFFNDNSAPWADGLAMRSYGDGTGGSDNLLVFDKTSALPRARLYRHNWGTTSAWGSGAGAQFRDFVMTAVNDPDTVNIGRDNVASGSAWLIARKLAHAPNASTAHIEAFSADDGTGAGEVSVRFHIGNRWWRQIRARVDGFHFTNGGDGVPVRVTASEIEFRDGSLNSTVRIIGENAGVSGRARVSGGSGDAGFRFTDAAGNTYGWVLGYADIAGLRLFPANGSRSLWIRNNDQMLYEGAQFLVQPTGGSSLADALALVDASNISGAALLEVRNNRNRWSYLRLGDALFGNYWDVAYRETGGHGDTRLAFRWQGAGPQVWFTSNGGGHFTGPLDVIGTPTFQSQSIHAAGARINTDQQLLYQRGSYTAGSGDWPYLPIIVSTSLPSGTAPENTIWIQVPS
jgi:hypothetical protein